MFLEAAAEKILGEIFNVGNQNLSLMEIVELVRKVVNKGYPERDGLEIVTPPSCDVRFNHINWDKLLGNRPLT
jgi:nucleoside-diphosphate-sugar epimerase